MRDRQSWIKSMSPALFLAHFLGGFALLALTACGEEQKKPVSPQGTGLALPEGVLFRPDSEFSPRLMLEPRDGKAHLLHIEVRVPDGRQLLSLRLLGPGPAFPEMGQKDTSQLDSPVIKETFEIAASGSRMQAKHVLVVAKYDSGSYAASLALPNF